MKHLIIWGFALFLLPSAFLYNRASADVQAALADDMTQAELVQAGGETGSTVYLKSFTGGAILNAEKDTLALPNFLSNYQLQVSIERASVSGTHNVKLLLDESNGNAGTANWRAIDSTSTTTATLAHVRQATTYGLRHRLRVVGSGTQSSTYVVRVVAKKLN